MAKKELVVPAEFTTASSPQLLVLLHAAKAKRDMVVAEQIAAEFLRRDRIAVNRSILGK